MVSKFWEINKKSEFLCEAAEEADLEKYEDTFDTIFTSPPYFNVERYSHDDTQSWVRYKDIDTWNKQFMFKTMDNILPTLKSGGKLCINISDVYSPSAGKKAWSKICDPMNEYLDEFRDMEYIGCIGMEMAKRPNSGGAGTAAEERFKDETRELAEVTKDKTFCEPIWIWKQV